ncbi:hypothetical protein QEN58_05915 [Halomonas alkaliantarctica]|uniref:Uncharacterized protein n=1 Tax=Halomonas alkaliantarctica TaxID=232346 RepID=A0ABY8LQ98_9GAMM|nr:hypothetical protein [Halomonas alkaliantarctica]WGI26593.1 hypothetical protein QEN58_05915 [Halomonas alkaliantarctica]
MTIEVRSVDKLKGEAPLTKLWHLYKTVCRRNLPVHLVENDLLITPSVLNELMRFDAQTFNQWKDCPGGRAMLQLRKSQENGPCRSSVQDSFKEKTKVLETAIVLFFLLVRGEAVDTNDPGFLEV